MFKIKTVTVLGANGTMGCNVSGIFASFGNAKVNLVCRDLENAKKVVEKAAKSVKADSIAIKLIPKTYSDLRACIEESDLVFESVAENIDLKRDINIQIAKYIKPGVIIATGTSGLSINELSKCFPAEIRPYYLGLHFYNPSYYMILCEVVPSQFTSSKVLVSLKDYLKRILYRNVVEVKDAPAFLGNRIGFQFINEAFQCAEQYKDRGGIDYVDSILGPFTGRSMPPLVTSDFVGLDVHKAIVDNIYNNTNDYARDTFRMPDYAIRLIEEGKLGKKSGCGLYQILKQNDGSKTINIYDISSGKYRPKKQYNFPFAKKMIEELSAADYGHAFASLIADRSREANLCLLFLLKYVIYSVAVASSVGNGIALVDDVMASGYNWAPPLSIITAFGGSDKFTSIALERLDKNYLKKANVRGILKGIPMSRYDYRPYFKAKGLEV